MAAELGLRSPAGSARSACDVSDWDQLLALVGEVTGTLGQLDVVFANAGWSAPTSFLGQAACLPRDWPGLVATNVLGRALTARAVPAER